MKRSIFTLAVLQKYLTDESKIYIFITKVPRVVHGIFFGFFEIRIFPTPGRYLQTAALKRRLNVSVTSTNLEYRERERKIRKRESRRQAGRTT